LDDCCCQAFRALSDKTRLQILILLKEREMCVSEICDEFDMKQPSISHHLDILKRCRLVTSEKRGREVYYKFEGESLVKCCGDQMKILDIVIKKR
jgi:DNA-binding transcriptional ArsR family regulator